MDSLFKNEGEYKEGAQEPSGGGGDMTCGRVACCNMATQLTTIILWLGGSEYLLFTLYMYSNVALNTVISIHFRSVKSEKLTIYV